MNFFKRAYLHTIRKKAKSVIMFFVLLIMATLTLVCISIQTATNTAALNIRRSLMGSFTINAKAVNTQLNEDTISKILKINGMTDNYNLRSYYHAEYQNIERIPLNISTDGAAQIPEGYEHAGKIISNSHSEQDTYFKEVGFELVEGRHIVDNDNKVIIINKKFAVANNLMVGDTIVLRSLNKTDRSVEVKIVGIYVETQKQDAIGMAPSYDLYDNITFTDHKAYSQINFTTEQNHYQYGDFFVNDPAELDLIISNVKKLDGMDWDSCIITKHDVEYQNAKKALEALQNLITVIIIVLLFVCVVVLSLILLMWIRNRTYETAVLLSIGISKGKIVLQHMTEIFLITIFAFSLSVISSSLIAQNVLDSLLQQVVESEQVIAKDLTNGTTIEAEVVTQPPTQTIAVNISIQDFVQVCGIGFMVIIASLLLASYPIFKLKPKEIFSKMS